MSSFVDQVRINVKAGDGGDGCVSFHREKFVQNGGPDGGDGGHGGDISFLTDPNMHTLLDFRFRRKYYAGNGGNGSAGRSLGKRGESLTIKVPVGTVIRDVETGKVVADLDAPGEEKRVLRGGRGGWGNSHFATPTRQAPNFAKPGLKTQAHVFQLELKTIADVGMVGYPNVGKSTILSVVTSARPKIANYHFTTLTPNLGIVSHKGQDFVLADIPGLIEGAAEGAGLGHDFLRHVDRTRLLLHVIDVSGSEGRDPVEDLRQIDHELANYGELADKPQLIVCNKADLLTDHTALDRVRAEAKKLGRPLFVVSAATRQGFDALLDAVTTALETLPPVQHYAEEISFEEETVRSEELEIRREGRRFIVTGTAVESLIESVNFEDEESLNWFHRTLRRTGIIDALREKGAAEGDTVLIGEMEFDFVE